MAGHGPLIPTLKEDPADAEAVSHKLHGPRRLGPPARGRASTSTCRSAQRVHATRSTAIIREEMNAIGGQEITMPVLHPAEIWQQIGPLGRHRRRDVPAQGPQPARHVPRA
ncbi:MAG: hypothetical protein MZV64_70680 [Ignavibacteriales bacterium]|nr:hypothetical protein [Ignavibacteriales bacterium]